MAVIHQLDFDSSNYNATGGPGGEPNFTALVGPDVWSGNGGAIDTTNPEYGDGAMGTDGDSNFLNNTAGLPALDPNNCTVELSARIPTGALSSFYGLFFFGPAGDLNNTLQLLVRDTGALQVYYRLDGPGQPAILNIQSADGVIDDTHTGYWKFSLVMDNGTASLYAGKDTDPNMVQVATDTYVVTPWTAATEIRIGYSYAAGAAQRQNDSIDNYRVSDTALYSGASYPMPTEAFPDPNAPVDTDRVSGYKVLVDGVWKDLQPDHNLYGYSHTDVDSTGTPALRDVLEQGASQWQLGRRTRYIKEGFVQGTSYQIGDEVSNGSQISEAIVDGAVESPYIEPIGDVFNVYTGTPVTSTSGSINFAWAGNRYTIDNSGYLSSLRVYTYANQRYDVYVVRDPTGTPQFTQVSTVVGTAEEWRDVAINPTIVLAGTTFDVVCLVSRNDTVPVDLQATYDYQTPQNFIAPAAGEIIHARSQPDTMYVAYTDDNLNDNTVFLDDLDIGDTIEDGLGQVWSIQAAVSGTPTTGYVTYTVTPATTSPSGTREFTFNTTTAAPIDTGRDVDYWLTNPSQGTVQGLYTEDSLYSSITPDNTFYTTDIGVQQAYVPTEWQVKVLSEGAVGGGGGSFVPTTYTGPGTTGYVKDPVSNVPGGYLDVDGNFTVPSGVGGGGHVIQDEGADLPQRTNLNFVGTDVTATDDLANDATKVELVTANIRVSETYTVGTLGGEDFATLDEAIAFIDQRPYPATPLSNTSNGNVPDVSYTLNCSAETFTFTTLRPRFSNATLLIGGAGATFQGTFNVGRGVWLFMTGGTWEGTVNVLNDGLVYAYAATNCTNLRFTGNEGWIQFQSGFGTAQSLSASNESFIVFSNATFVEYFTLDYSSSAAFANATVTAPAPPASNPGAFAVRRGSNINCTTLTINGGDNGADPNLSALASNEGSFIGATSVTDNSTLANYTNIPVGEYSADGSVIFDGTAVIVNSPSTRAVTRATGPSRSAVQRAYRTIESDNVSVAEEKVLNFGPEFTVTEDTDKTTIGIGSTSGGGTGEFGTWTWNAAALPNADPGVGNIGHTQDDITQFGSLVINPQNLEGADTSHILTNVAARPPGNDGSTESAIYIQQQDDPTKSVLWRIISWAPQSGGTYYIAFSNFLSQGTGGEPDDGATVTMSIKDSGTSYKQVRNEGVVVPARNQIDFKGNGVNVQDNSGLSVTEVTIPSTTFAQLPAGEPIIILSIGDYNNITNGILPAGEEYDTTVGRIFVWSTDPNAANPTPQSGNSNDYGWYRFQADAVAPSDYDRTTNANNENLSLFPPFKGYVGVLRSNRPNPAISLAIQLRETMPDRDVYVVCISEADGRIQDLNVQNGSMINRIATVFSEFTIPGTGNLFEGNGTPIDETLYNDRVTRPRTADIVLVNYGPSNAADVVESQQASPDPGFLEPIRSEEYAENYINFMTAAWYADQGEPEGIIEPFYTLQYMFSIPSQFNDREANYDGLEFTDGATNEYFRGVDGTGLGTVSDSLPAGQEPATDLSIYNRSMYSAIGVKQIGIEAARTALVGVQSQTYPITAWDIRPALEDITSQWTFTNTLTGADGEFRIWADGLSSTGWSLRIRPIDNAGKPWDMDNFREGDVLTFGDVVTPIVTTISSNPSWTGTEWQYDVTDPGVAGGEGTVYTLTTDRGGFPVQQLKRDSVTGNLVPSNVFSNNLGGQVAINAEDPNNIENTTFYVESRAEAMAFDDTQGAFSGNSPDTAFWFRTPPSGVIYDANPAGPDPYSLGYSDRTVWFRAQLANGSIFNGAADITTATFSGSHAIIFQTGAETDATDPYSQFTEYRFQVNNDAQNGRTASNTFWIPAVGVQPGGGNQTLCEVRSQDIHNTSGTGGGVVAIEPDPYALYNTGKDPSNIPSAAAAAYLSTVAAQELVPVTTISTSSPTWMQIDSYTVQPGDAARCTFWVEARKTSGGVGFYEAEWKALIYEDGGNAQVEDTEIYAHGPGLLGFRIQTSGADVNFEVRGDIDDWDWTVYAFARDLD